jgi:type II secretory pathway pseudopilin PulG
MKTRSDKWPVTGDKTAAMRESRSRHLSRVTCHAFTLVEVLVVFVLLSLIVLALMAVFNTTQNAFRASVTQADILETGRAAMDMMTADLRTMTPSDGVFNTTNGVVNFYAGTSAYQPPVCAYQPPLIQPMIGSINSSQRTNVLENIFILSRGNANGVPTWYGTGYAVVATNATGSLYSLYRFATNHAVAAVDPAFLFQNDFVNFLQSVTNGSHLMDGVLSLTVKAYDLNGIWLTNGFGNLTNLTVKNTWFSPPAWGQVGLAMFSNTLPASVEIEMGVLEDRALQRAESIPVATVQSNYLVQQAGKVHVFRQRVSIPNFDPSAYQ